MDLIENMSRVKLYAKLPSSEVVEALQTSPSCGLTTEQIYDLRKQYGSNKLQEEEKVK